MNIEFSKKAKKQLDLITDIKVAKRLINGISKLKTLEGDIKKLIGYENMYRLRIGDYRVIFAIENGILIIVEAILPRGNAYNRY